MKIDLHCHTVFSGDSHLTPGQLMRLARERGMDAVAITEHNSFDASAPAEKDAALEGFTLFRGVEVSTDRGHLQLFGIADDSWNIWGSPEYFPSRGVLERARELNALVIAAHPYGKRDKHATLDAVYALEGLSALECANGRSREGEDELTQKAAQILGLPGTGGSDCHRDFEVASCYTELERTVATLAELINEIRGGHCRPVRTIPPLPPLR